MCNTSHKTQQWVTLAKDGDETALERLYLVYGERVRWMARFGMGKGLRSKLESMDLVQDTFMHAFQGMDHFTYTNEGDMVRWLTKIAQNVVRDQRDKLYAAKRDIRKERPLGRYPSTAGFRGSPLGLGTTTPSMIASRHEDLARLENAIDELKPEYRDVIILSKIEGLSYTEIGKQLGKSPDAVRMMMPSAMAELTTVFMRI